jgi:hypothetical protein
MWHAWERKEKFTNFWWESPKERDHSDDRDVEGRMGSEWILWGLAKAVWSELSWVSIGPRGGLL